MKKIILASTLLLAMLSTETFADVPNQVQLHYTGTIINKPCEVSLGSTTTLNMGDLDIATFSTAGTTSPWLNYNVLFSNCDVSTSINISSSPNGAYTPYNPMITVGTFAVYNSQSELLKDIGLQVWADGDNDMYKYFGSTRLVIIPDQHEGQELLSYNMPIKFRFYNLTGAPPQPGGITGVFTMTVEYN
ncbi:fimbrial protein [Buttiauxella selenatireducens]|uniref:Fimbrial protein n=1 Tax=Buttiauxella selenatireducens TaxID=3073902 RepID=A0ABY9SFE8_9ENTR|nr:fimbrial protein [Buttiauxella sp. R73]WMY75570.1 fimbrial protein [Buttiauxella sp. R73]